MQTIWRLTAAIFALAFWGVSATAQDDPELPAIPDLRTESVHPAWADFEPEFTPYVCPFHAQAPKYDPEEFRCGYVLVPEDRTNPDSRLIQLSVLKIASSSDNPNKRAVVRLTGGPGGPSLGAGRMAAYQAPPQQRFRDAADLIFFDQRGIGYSEAHFCRAVPRSFQNGLLADEGVEKWVGDAQKCLDEARAKGIAIDAYSTWQNAYDVRDIRKALGYEQWTLFGVSYGTMLGQAILEIDRDGVRAAILDSVVPVSKIEGEGWSTFAYGFRSALTSLDASCQDDKACARDISAMSDRFIDAFLALEEEPLILEDLDEGSYLDGRLVMDGTVAAGAVFQALYRNELYADFPWLLRAIETRDAEAISAYAAVLGRTIDHSYGNGMELVANCRSSTHNPPDIRAEEIAAEPVLTRLMGTLPENDLCDRFYRLDPDPAVKPLVTAVPILIGAGATDPITPPNYGQAILPGLANAQYVEFPHTGHGVFVSHFDGCGGDLWLAFLDDPNAEIDTTCLAEIEAPEFLTRLIETKAPYKLARGIQAGNYPILVMIIAGLLVVSLFAFPFGWAARAIQGSETTALDRARPLAWGGALAALLALVLAITQILKTATEHAIALPLGVLPAAGWSVWLALLGFGLTAFALYRAIMSGGFGLQTIGTSIGLAITSAGALYVLIFLLSLGLGPF